MIKAEIVKNKCLPSMCVQTAKIVILFSPLISIKPKISRVLRVMSLYAYIKTNNIAQNVFTRSHGRVQGHFSVRMAITTSVTIIDMGMDKLNRILLILSNP